MCFLYSMHHAGSSFSHDKVKYVTFCCMHVGETEAVICMEAAVSAPLIMSNLQLNEWEEEAGVTMDASLQTACCTEIVIRLL